MQCPNCGFWQADYQGDVCIRCGHAISETDRSGPPWENRRSPLDFQALLNTLSGVLFRPAETFRGMRRTGGLGGPLWYAVVLGTIGGWFSILWQAFFQSLGVLGQGMGEEEIFAYIAYGVFAVLMPFLVALGVFIYSAITHLCLLIVGGAGRGFETTFRVTSYVCGSTSVFEVLPLCGGIIGFFWYIVAQILGVREAHEISTGKAILAVLLPLIVCCGCGVLIGLMVFGAAVTELFRNL